MSADTDLIRAYGSASTGHSADLQAVASRLTALDIGSASMTDAMFGPVGARFRAALSRAAGSEARRVAELGASIAAASHAACTAAHAYEDADVAAGNRLTGSW